MRTEFGELVRETRTDKGLTQKQLSALAGGLSRSYLAQIELGRRQPSEAVVRTLARALGLYLFEAYASAGLLSEEEIDLGDLALHMADEEQLADREALLKRDRVVFGGGTYTRQLNGGPPVETQLREVPIPPFAPLIGFELLTPANQSLVQQLVTNLLAGQRSSD